MLRCLGGLVALAMVSAPAEASPAAPVGLTQDAVARMSTGDVARLLLPPELAAEATDHRLAEPIVQGAPPVAVTFALRPRPLGRALCERESVYVSLQATDEGRGLAAGGLSRFDQIVAAPGCRLRAGAFFGTIQFTPSVEAATEALTRLIDLQRRARGARPLRLPLRCKSELRPELCAGGARAVLAQLPLDRIYLIEPLDRTRHAGWSFAVMPRGPGQPFWSVALEEAPGKPRSLSMTWGVPAPF